MAYTPITWQNINGPSLAEASRPLEAAQRSFGNIFDNFGTLLKETEDRAEVGRGIVKNRNTDALQDLFANAKTPEEVAAARLQAATMRAQFGDMVNADEVRGLDEQRLNAVRNNITQGQNFGIAQRDFNEAGLVDSIKAKIASNDPVIRAQGIAEAQQAQVRQRSLLVAAATDADRSGMRFDEDKKQWVRNEGEYKDKLLTNLVGRQTSVMNAGSNRISANASATQAQTSKSRLGLEEKDFGLRERQFGLGVRREMNNQDERLADRESAAVKASGAGAMTSVRSSANADVIASALKGVDDSNKGVAQEYLRKAIEANLPIGEVTSTLPTLKSTFFGTDGGDAEKAFRTSVERASKGNTQQRAANFQSDQYLGAIEKIRTERANLAADYGQFTRGIAPGSVPVAAVNPPIAPGLPLTNAPTGGTETQREAATQDFLRKQFAAQSEYKAPPPPTPEQRYQTAQAAWEAAGRKAGPEMTEMRNARAAIQESASKLANEQELSSEIKGETTRELRNLDLKIKSLRNEAEKFSSKNKTIPPNVAKFLSQAERDAEILRSRLR